MRHRTRAIDAKPVTAIVAASTNRRRPGQGEARVQTRNSFAPCEQSSGSRPSSPRVSARYAASLARIASMSSFENARRVSVRTLPAAPIASPKAVADSSSGALMIATTSYWPSVQ